MAPGSSASLWELEFWPKAIDFEVQNILQGSFNFFLTVFLGEIPKDGIGCLTVIGRMSFLHTDAALYIEYTM